jgi:hypothetical protein
MDIVQRILIFITQLTGLSLQSLHQRFDSWIKPETSSLLLGTLTDLSRPKSELVAENARYAPTTDHPASTGETASMHENGSDAPGSSGQDSPELETSPPPCPARDAPTLASSGFQALLEIQVQGSFSQAKDLPGDRRLDSGDGKEQPTVGSRTHPRRTPQVEHSRF